jgi:Kef-type K+ transport system membrane component KefB
VISGRVIAAALSRLGQPAVIGEVLSGILLGPSLLGAVSPAAEAFLFPASVRPPLGAIAQAGVVIYMFLVGLEFDAALLRRRGRSLAVVSQASIAVPFALGCALALALYGRSAPPGVSRGVFVLFTGVAMSITAFPVLARILTDRGMTRTELGVAALTCAAINDVMAWCLLGIVVGVSRAMPTSGVPGELVLAFAAGAIVPGSSRFAVLTARWLQAPVTLVLLPAFFALTGLRTEIALLSSPVDWLECLAVVAVATVGKFGGAAAAGGLSGMSWRFAAALGALMNTRGLMELIVLTVGLQAGIITPRLFAIMVIMAIVTTAMTGPLLDLIVEGGGEDAQDDQEGADA